MPMALPILDRPCAGSLGQPRTTRMALQRTTLESCRSVEARGALLHVEDIKWLAGPATAARGRVCSMPTFHLLKTFALISRSLFPTGSGTVRCVEFHII